MFVVTGVTGNTGNIVAGALLAQRRPVRVIVRDAAKGEAWKAQGAEVAVASLDDVAAMTDALRGAEGAYLLVPPNPAASDLLQDRARLADALAQAVEASGVNHVVMLSSVGGHLPDGTGPIRTSHYSEQVIPPAATNSTILRPAYFFENWAPLYDPSQGALHNFLTPDQPLEMNSTTDIGRVAAELLLDPAVGRRIVEMAGPQPYTPVQIAAVFSARLETHPLEAVVPALTAAGVSEDLATLLREMYAGLNSGHVAYETSTLRRGTVTAEQALNPVRASSAQSH